MFIWLNVLIIIELHTVSSRSAVQTNHHDIDDISFNPAYGGKPLTLPTVLASCCIMMALYCISFTSGYATGWS